MTSTGTLNTLRTKITGRNQAGSAFDTGHRSSGAHAGSTIDQHSPERVGERRQRRTNTPTAYRRRPNRRGRLGSQQQVSVRGRRIAPIENPNRRKFRIIALCVAVVCGAIASIMILSGLTTEKTFQISEAEKKSETLSNEIVSLQRDVEKAKSAQNLSAKAADLGMVVPGQAGILDANGKKVHERRGSDNGNDRPVIDVSDGARTRGATSDPEETRNIPGLAPQSPEGAAAQLPSPAPSTGDIPYANSGMGGAPAPAAPAPAAAAPAAPAPAPAA